MPPVRFADQVLGRLEQATVLDRTADLTATLLRKIIRPGPVEDVLSGRQIGHPAHPALVALPIGSWATATVLDVTGGDAAAARRAVGLGVLFAVPTALSGASDWLSTEAAERRVGLVHAVANYAGLSLQIASWVHRRRGRRGRGAALSLAAMTCVGAGGWLGGHLAYALGVGVDTTVFQQLPVDWTDVTDESSVPATGSLGVEAGGIPILLTRVDGAVAALVDRCTHRGAPLHEGDVADGCVTCPWHGSVFDLSDGAVVSGPATRPQPVFEVDIRGGRVFVRRREVRTLRTHPSGS